MYKVLLIVAVMAACVSALHVPGARRKQIKKLQEFIRELEEKVHASKQARRRATTPATTPDPFAFLRGEAQNENCHEIADMENIYNETLMVAEPVTADLIRNVIKHLNDRLYIVHQTVGFMDLNETRRHYFCVSVETQILILRMSEYGLSFKNNFKCDLPHLDNGMYELNRCFEDCDIIWENIAAAFFRFHEIIYDILDGSGTPLENTRPINICRGAATLSKMGLRMNGLFKFLVENNMCVEAEVTTPGV